MAGSARAANDRLPNLWWSENLASTAPGTVMGRGPFRGIPGGVRSSSCSNTASGVAAAGARPEPFSPCSLPPSQTSAKTSLPIPLEVGSTTVKVMPVAIAASTALPPC